MLEFPRSIKFINRWLLDDKIIGPLAIGTAYPDLSKRGLFCVTETMPRAEIERLVACIKRILESTASGESKS